MRWMARGLVAFVGLGLAACGSDEPTVIEGVEAIVFAKRQMYYPPDENGVRMPAVVSGDNQVLDYQRYVPGGGLYMLEPPTPSGTLTNLTPSEAAADFQGLDVSFDGQEVVFSMKRAPDDSYHLYLVNVRDPEGSLRQITFGAQDDVHPIFLPGGRVGYMTNPDFADERPQHLDEYERGRAIQLATIGADGSGGVVCSENLSHSVYPFLRADGRIGYSRWEHLAGVNDTKLFAANPDCTQMVALGGQHGKPANSIVQVREVAPNLMVGIATNRDKTIQAGAIVRVNSQRAGGGVSDIDEENATFEILTPGVPTGEAPSPVGRYRTPYPIDANRVLTSWAPGEVNPINELTATPPDFGIYLFDDRNPEDRLVVYNDPDTWDLFVAPLRARETPPVIPSGQTIHDDQDAVRLGAIDVRDTSLGDGLKQALEEGAVGVRILEGFSGEIGGVRDFGMTESEGAALLGEAPVYADGSYEAFIPPNIPVHQQAIDKFGLSIRSESLWIQGVPGEDRRCGGCHESRTSTLNTSLTTIAQQSPAAFVRNVDERATPVGFDVTSGFGTFGEVPWNTSLQTMFNDNCVSCHNETTSETYTLRVTDAETGETSDYVIPRLDLSDRPVEALYMEDVVTYPASYVSLLFPHAIGMIEVDFELIDGEIPPNWIVPESARDSVAIQHLNLEAVDGDLWFPEAPLHPEEVGGEALTPEERYLLVLMADAGGQYYARSNSAGAYGDEYQE